MASDGIKIKLTDNSTQVLSLADAAMLRGLAAIGATAEWYAKKDCPVDTGRLRNSITHATDETEKAEYIGTNVEYGPYVELGTYKMAARPFLRPAAQNHSREYKQIMKESMENA